MTQATRIEEDLLGQRQVPLEAYWGIHTLRAQENFQISKEKVADLPTFVRGMVTVKKASALANKELGVIDPQIADAIVWACDQVLENRRCMDQFPIDVFQGGAGTSINMNTNEVIANLALEHMGYAKGRYDIINPNDHVNKSQSTNDAYPTGFRLGLFHKVDQLEAELSLLIGAFNAKGDEFADILKMGRTQLQDAVPMSLGQEFHAFAVLLGEEIPRLRNNANLLEATSDTGAYVSIHAAIKRLAVKLSKICNDLRLLSSGPRAGLGEISLPERQAGSSIMPAKVNPVIPEVVNQVCFKVIGNDLTVTMAAEAGQLQLNVMEPVICQATFESSSLLIHAMQALREKCVVGIKANVDVCRNHVLGSIGIVTYLNPVIGHHNGDLVGRECARSGRNVREVVLEMGLLDEATLDELLSVENLLRPHYRSKKYYSGGDPNTLVSE